MLRCALQNKMDDLWIVYLLLLALVVWVVRVAMNGDTGPPQRESKAQKKKAGRERREFVLPCSPFLFLPLPC